MPVDHYENFPVASVLLPRRLRRPIEHIYQFARSADDFADEGNVPATTRLANLAAYEHELDLIASGTVSTFALFDALGSTIRQYNLPLGLFYDLLNAFKQDVTKTRYADFAELADYCQRSANPVGRLLLHLFDEAGSENLLMSDDICTALQLINHWQDIAIDWQKNDSGRLYLPEADLAYYGISTSDIVATRATGKITSQWREMMKFQVARARQIMIRGQPLAHKIKGRFGAELRLIVSGGLAICDKIDNHDGDVFNHRPKLTKWDWLRLVPAALLKLR